MSLGHTLKPGMFGSDSASNERVISERNRVLGMIGTIVFFVWILLVYFGDIVPTTDSALSPIFKTIGSAGIIFGFFTARFISNEIITPVLKISTFAFIALVFLCWLPVYLQLADVESSFVLISMQWFFMGIITSEILLEIGLFYIHLYVVRGNYVGPYTVIGIVVVGIAFFILTTTKVTLPAFLTIVLLPLIAQTLLALFPMWFPTRNLQSQKDGLKLPEFRRTIWGMFFYCLITGFFIAFWNSNLEPFSLSLWVCAPGIILGGILFGILPLLFRGKATLNLTRWFLLPVPVAILLLLPLVNANGQLVLSVCWFATFTCYLTACLTTLILLITNDTTINAIHSLGFGGMMGVLGCGMGWYFGTYVLFSQDIIPPNLASIILVLLFLISFTIFYKPSPHFQNSVASIGHWKRRCNEICENYQLSPREREVFYLLSKGRNAEFIQGVLYISTHTVKTHIYHIYRKLNIHTQQELLDMFDIAAPPKQDESVVE